MLHILPGRHLDLTGGHILVLNPQHFLSLSLSLPSSVQEATRCRNWFRVVGGHAATRTVPAASHVVGARQFTGTVATCCTHTPSGVDEDAEEAADLFNTATDLLQQGIETEAAIAMFHRSNTLFPQASTFFNLAHAYIAAGDTDKAIGALQSSLDLDDSQSDVLVNLGTAYLTEQRFAEAIPVLEKALAIDASDWTTHHAIGVAYEKQSELENALNSYKKAKELQPALPEDIIRNCVAKLAAAKAAQLEL